MQKEITKYMSRLWQSNLTTSLGGNISYRKDNETFLITPSSIDKMNLTNDDILTIDKTGKVIDGYHKPSIEYLMHLRVLENRPDVNAVIHAHPFYSTLFSASNTPININFTAEAFKNINKIGKAQYYTMGTEELANEVATVAKENNVVLMENHGVLTVGKTLLEAFYRMEVLETAAKMTYSSLSLQLRELSKQNKKILTSLM